MIFELLWKKKINIIYLVFIFLKFAWLNEQIVHDYTREKERERERGKKRQGKQFYRFYAKHKKYFI